MEGETVGCLRSCLEERVAKKDDLRIRDLWRGHRYRWLSVTVRSGSHQWNPKRIVEDAAPGLAKPLTAIALLLFCHGPRVGG